MALHPVALLLVAAATMGFLHSVLPDHWVPIAVVARSNHWSLRHTAKTSLWAGVGHVGGSLAIGAAVIAVGAGVRTLVALQGRIVGVLLVATGAGLLAWAAWGRATGSGHGHPHAHDASRSRGPEGVDATAGPRRPGGWAASLAVPFGVAASPDLTILPVFLAAGAVGLGASLGVVAVFAAVTIATFVALTVAATTGGYRLEWPWLERNAELVSAGVLIALGIVAYFAL